MSEPFLVVQLSDPHIGATWSAGDPAAGLEAVVESVCRMPDAPERVVAGHVHRTMAGELASHVQPVRE